MAEQKQDDQLEHTHSSSVRIRVVALKTSQRRWTIGRSGERGSGISVLAARHDDDDHHHHHLRYFLLFTRFFVVFYPRFTPHFETIRYNLGYRSLYCIVSFLLLPKNMFSLYIKQVHRLSVTIIVVRKEVGNPSPNPGQGCLHFSLFEKGMNPPLGK